MKIIAIVLVLFATFGPVCAKEPARKGTPGSIIEDSIPLPPTDGMLGTISYRPTTKETPYFAKLAQDETITNGLTHVYSMKNKLGHYVSWCGIVRAIDNNPKDSTTKLLVEMKYFDGQQDAHMMTVAWHGSGEFTVRLKGNHNKIPLLSLVRVYGKVQDYKGEIPTLDAEYVRVWPWGLFNFMNLGKQAGQSKWEHLCKIDEKEIYTAYPNFKYYVDRLGPAPANQPFGGFTKSSKPDSITDKQIQESANPIRLYIQRALDRLEHRYITGGLNDINAALQLNPDLAPAYGLRSMAERELGQYEASLSDANYALRLNPLSAAGYASRGETFSAMGNHQAALSDFSKTIEINPAETMGYALRGMEYDALGKYAEAVKDYDHYLASAPKARYIVNKRDKAKAKLKAGESSPTTKPAQQ